MHGSRLALTAALATTLATVACRKSEAPGSAPAPAPGSAPALATFCPQDLSGDWLNASDQTFSYRLKDKGDLIEGRFLARGADGGLRAPEAGDEPLTLELHRTSGALAGVLRSFERHPDTGRRCPVEFGLKVSRCGAGELQIVAEMAYPLAADCSRRREADGGELPPDLAEFLWTRLR